MQSTADGTHIPVLDIIDTGEELTQLLEAIFQIEGFRVVSGYTVDVKQSSPSPGMPGTP